MVTFEVRELNTQLHRVTTFHAKRTCSPFFAITPVYCGGTAGWDTKRWNLTHIPTGLTACYGPIKGRYAAIVLRTLAGVLSALGDWSTAETAKAARETLPEEIFKWMGKL